jgi:hypothetical protein
MFGTDSGNAQLNFERSLLLLEQVLGEAQLLPQREFSSVEALHAYLQEQEEIIFDGTEFPIERPSQMEAQKQAYSGKKTHVKKALILSNKHRKISYISKLYTGARHDYAMLKAEFPADLPWFTQYSVWLDSGFQGFQDSYSCKSLQISFRRKRVKKGQTNELGIEQKAHNQMVSKERIFVEHSIGGLKRFRILYHRIRIKKEEILNRIVNVCAGLWNFSLQDNVLIMN